MLIGWFSTKFMGFFSAWKPIKEKKGWAIKKKAILFWNRSLKRNQNSEISHIWKVYRIFIFYPILMLLFFGLFVLRSLWIIGTVNLYLIVTEINSTKRCQIMLVSKIGSFIFHLISMQFLQNVHLNGPKFWNFPYFESI